jgi:hypothetical protein
MELELALPDSADRATTYTRTNYKSSERTNYSLSQVFYCMKILLGVTDIWLYKTEQTGFFNFWQEIM